MKLRLIISIAVALMMLDVSCMTVGPQTKMTGETASVRLEDGTSASVEILAVGDSSILCLPAPGEKSRKTSHVQEIPAASITHIEVSGFRNNSWWLGVIVFEVLPAAGLTAAASSAHMKSPGEVFAAAIIPAVFTTVLYAASGVPTPTFDGPISKEQLLELRKFARFGGNLTPAQKEQLLGMQGKPASE